MISFSKIYHIMGLSCFRAISGLGMGWLDGISVRGYSMSIALVWFSSYLSSQKLSVDGAVHRTLLSTALYLLIEFSCVLRQFLVSI